VRFVIGEGIIAMEGNGRFTGHTASEASSFSPTILWRRTSPVRS